MSRKGVYSEKSYTRFSTLYKSLIDAAEEAAKRSTCHRRQVGASACITSAEDYMKHDVRIYIGWNGVGCDPKYICPHGDAPIGTEAPCPGMHAEAMLLDKIPDREECIIQGLFVTSFPCMACAERIVESNTHHLYFLSDYGSNKAMRYLLDNGVNVIRIYKL